MGRKRWSGLGLAGALLVTSVFVVARPQAEASPGLAGPVHMNPTSWNPTDDNEPFESSGPFVFDSRQPEARNTGAPRNGVGSFAQACRVALNSWPPLEPAYLSWRVKVESTDDYFAGAQEASHLIFYLDNAHTGVSKALVQVPGYDNSVDAMRKYDWHLQILREMIGTGGGLAPVFPDVGIPWERWDAAWDNLSQAHDAIMKTCP